MASADSQFSSPTPAAPSSAHWYSDAELIIDAVGGPTFGLVIKHVAPRGIVVNVATQTKNETVTFHATRFDRARGRELTP